MELRKERGGGIQIKLITIKSMSFEILSIYILAPNENYR